MPTAQEVDEQLKRLDTFSKFATKREIKALPSILWEGEQLVDGVQGTIDARFGLLIATDQRLIFVEKSMTGKLRVEDFPYDKITSLQYETGWVSGKITIYASGNKAEIQNIMKDSTQPFAESVRARVSSASPARPAPVAAAPPSAGQVDAVDRLERLAALRASGALTDDEFAAAKAKLLGGL